MAATRVTRTTVSLHVTRIPFLDYGPGLLDVIGCDDIGNGILDECGVIDLTIAHTPRGLKCWSLGDLDGQGRYQQG